MRIPFLRFPILHTPFLISSRYGSN
jgi:hypothetical protein